MLNKKKYNNYNTFNNNKNINNKLIYNLTKNEVPLYLKEKNIYTGYRLNGDYYTCLLSLFKIHNETLNAWTMIIGSIISSYYLYYYMNLFQFSCNLDKIPFYCLWLSSILHMPLSVGNHLFLCINKKTFTLWKKIDLIGIFFVSVLLTYSFSYFIFKNIFITLYLTLFSFLIYSFATITISNKDYNKGINKLLHTIGIGFAVCIYLLPIIINIIYDFNNYNSFLDYINNSKYLYNIIIILSSLFCGAILFILQIPEKYYPYKFDIIGNSHQLMHITLIIAHIAEYKYLELVYINYSNYINNSNYIN